MNRRGAWEDVALHIRTMIFDSVLARGDRVPQDEIAAELGISRIPVREAIIALERDAWVRILPHRGAFVVGLDETTVSDVYEILGLVYGLVARRAAERAEAADVTTLTDLHKALDNADSPDAVLAANEAFLGELRRLGGSPRISATLRSMGGLVPGNFFAVVPTATAVQRRGARAVVKAIRAGDADASADAMSSLMRAQGRSVVAILAERGVLA